MRSAVSTRFARCQPFAATLLRTSLFWDVMRRRLVVGLLNFLGRLSVPSSGVMDCLTLDDGTCILSRNVRKKLATYCRKTSERSEGLNVFVCLDANAETFPKLQVANLCFSCSSPDLN